MSSDCSIKTSLSGRSSLWFISIAATLTRWRPKNTPSNSEKRSLKSQEIATKRFPTHWTHKVQLKLSLRNGRSMTLVKICVELAIFTNWMTGLEWSSQSPDINPVENFCLNLKRAVHSPSPSDLTELGLFYKEEWRRIAVSRCAWLTETYPQRLSAEIAAKSASAKYWYERGEHLCDHSLYLKYF